MTVANDEKPSACSDPRPGLQSDGGIAADLCRTPTRSLNFGDLAIVSTLRARVPWKNAVPRKAVIYLRLVRLSLSRFKARHERPLAWSLVVGLHVGLTALLLLGMVLHLTTAPEPSIQITLGGPLGAPVHQPPREPVLIDPDLPQVTEPPVESADEDANLLGGSPNVTRPAEAIAEHHELPRLPNEEGSKRETTVRLELSITADGNVSDAQVTSSSGSSSLDSSVVAWVKQHWRYRPALRNGIPIAVSTSAVVQLL